MQSDMQSQLLHVSCVCRLEYLRTTLYCHYLTLPVGGRGLGGSRREAFCLLFGSMAQCGGGGSWSEGSMAQCGGGGSWSEGLQLLQVCGLH